MAPPMPESAWERGLRHAKEIIRASAKRKQTDVDFEEKKINLSLAGEEDEEIDDKENTHYVRKPDLEVQKRSVVAERLYLIMCDLANPNYNCIVCECVCEAT